MTRILALILALATAQPSFAAEPLREALEQLHGHVRFIDLSREGRLVHHGNTLMKVGVMGLQEMPNSDGDEDGEEAVLIWAAVSLIALGIGGVMHLTGRAMQNAKPPARLTVGQAPTYMTAEGLNLFMQFPVDEQYEFARNEPELSTFLVKLNDAYNLIKYYRMLRD